MHFTIRSFFEKDLPDLIVTKRHEKTKLSSAPHPDIIASVGLEAAKARAKDVKVGLKALRRERLDTCSYPGCQKTAPDNSVNFSQCKTCFEKMQRRVLYCSKSVLHDLRSSFRT